MDVAERRARLVQRHRLSPARPREQPLEAQRGRSSCCTRRMPVTVFLSVHARTSNVAARRTSSASSTRSAALVRMLGMRRTLFVVPRELVPVVYAACTRTIAARERRRLEKMIADSGISTRPAAWLTRALTAALQARSRRGARHSRPTSRRTSRCSRSAFASAWARSSRPPRASDRACFRSWRWRAGSSAAVPAAPGSAASTAGCRWRAGWTAAYRRVEPRTAQAELLRHWLARVRARDRDRHSLVDGMDGTRGARRTRRRAARGRRSRRRSRIRPRRRPRARRAARALGRAAAHARPDDDGLEGARLVPRRSRRAAVRLERQRGPDRVVGRKGRRRLVAAAQTARSCSGCSRTSAETPSAAVETEAARVASGSATSASRPASCRRSSASWRR